MQTRLAFNSGPFLFLFLSLEWEGRWFFAPAASGDSRDSPIPDSNLVDEYGLIVVGFSVEVIENDGLAALAPFDIHDETIY